MGLIAFSLYPLVGTRDQWYRGCEMTVSGFVSPNKTGFPVNIQGMVTEHFGQSISQSLFLPVGLNGAGH